jgi:EAL and modified HD-GYP domain-containing signal transduction protein
MASIGHAPTETRQRAPASAPALIARQPILTKDRHVFGYELVCRPLDVPSAPDMTPEFATAAIMTDAIQSTGLDRLTHGRPAFLRVPPAFLQRDLVRVLPPGRVVLEVPAEGVDDATIAACRELRREGYQLAVDDFALTGRAAELLPLADFVKVDFLSTSSRDATAFIAAERNHKGAAMVANRVDAVEVFDEAVREGFTHFQGFFFERPSGRPGGTIPRGKIDYLRLLRALGDPALSVQQLEDLVKHDASLCYRILRTVNSAGFAQSREITSIRQALVLLGRDTIRRWASLWVLADLGADAHSELVVMATVRARFCELLAARSEGDDAAGEGFLLGMTSLLDVILQRGMSAVLEELPLSEALRSALLGYDNTWRQLLDCVVAYERGDWGACLPLASLARVDRRWLPSAYMDALHWAHELQQAPPPSA